MRVTMVWLSLSLASCSSSSASLAPDGPPPTSVHDLDVVPCDGAWTATATTPPVLCERACATPPIAAPCGGKQPCYDHPMCSVARRADTEPMTCDHTFVAADSAGMHTGCCYEHANDSFNPAMYFAECQQ